MPPKTRKGKKSKNKKDEDEKSENEENISEDEISLEPPKKRGKTAKISENANTNTTPISHTSPIVPLNPEESLVPIAEPPKSKRGRKKKGDDSNANKSKGKKNENEVEEEIIAQDDESAILASLPEQATQTKKKRGRPKKSELQVDQFLANTEVSQPSADSNTTPPEPVLHKRGRPKKGEKREKKKYIKKGQPGYVKPIYKYVKKKPTKAAAASFQILEEEEEKIHFSNWNILEKDLFVVSGDDYFPVFPETHPFKLNGEDLHSLKLFDSLIDISDPHDNEHPQYILNTGGPVWALDWAPVPDEEEQFLAIACNKDSKNHVQGQKYTGKNSIQIWSLGSLSSQTDEEDKPHLALAIAHESGYVIDLRWCPKGGFMSSDQENEVDRLGILAVAFGDYSLNIFAVPHPTQLDEKYSSKKGFPVLKLIPVLKTTFECSIERISWKRVGSPVVLAGGCYDGSLCLWNLNQFEESNANSIPENITQNYLPYIRVPAHSIKIVDICWSSLKEFLLVTASVDGFKVWDIRNPLQPAYLFQKLFEGWNTTMNFVVPSEKFIAPCVLLGTDENSVRSYDLKDYCFTRFKEGNDSGTVWHLDSSAHTNKILLSCDSEGNVNLFDLLQTSTRTRPKPLAFAKISKESEKVFRLSTFNPSSNSSVDTSEPEQIEQVDSEITPTATPKKVKVKTGIAVKKFPDTSVGIHKVRWNCNRLNVNWCAFGSAIGIVQVICCKYEPHRPEKKKKKKETQEL